MVPERLSSRESIAAVIITLAVALAFPVKALPAPVVHEKTSSVYEAALSAYSLGDYGKAARLLKKKVRENPDAKSYYLLGYASYKLGDRIAAKRYFGEAYLIDPRLDPRTILLQARKEKEKKKKTERGFGTKK